MIMNKTYKKKLFDALEEKYSNYDVNIESLDDTIKFDSYSDINGVGFDNDWEVEVRKDGKIEIRNGQTYHPWENNPIKANIRRSWFKESVSEEGSKSRGVKCSFDTRDEDTEFYIDAYCWKSIVIDPPKNPKDVIAIVDELDQEVYDWGIVPVRNRDIVLINEKMPRVDPDDLKSDSEYFSEDPCEFEDANWDGFFTKDELEKRCK